MVHILHTNQTLGSVMGFKEMPADNIKVWRDWHNRDHYGKWSTCCYEPCRSAAPKFRTDWENTK